MTPVWVETSLGWIYCFIVQCVFNTWGATLRSLRSSRDWWPLAHLVWLAVLGSLHGLQLPRMP